MPGGSFLSVIDLSHSLPQAEAQGAGMRFAVALSFPSPWRQCGIVVGFARATSPGAAIAVRCVILLAGLALCGCSTGDGALTPMETSFAPTAPDISLVAEKIQTLF